MVSNFGPTPEELAKEVEFLTKRLEVANIDEANYFPQFFQIETIRHCNARCPFCAVEKWDMSKPLMDDWLFDKIAEELSHYKHWVRMVDIQRAGEPLLDKKLPQRVKKVKDYGLRFVNISTNGSLLDETRGRALLEAGIDEVLISIDSVEKDTYEKLRVRLDYDAVLANIRTFFRLREEINPNCIIRVRGVACFDADDPAAQREIDSWEAFWGPLRKPHDRIYMKKLHTWGNAHLWDEQKDHYVHDLLWQPCIAPWSTFHVTSMGKVPLCGQDMDAGMQMGDLNTQSITEVWRSETFQRVRSLHAAGRRNDITYCRGCRVFDPGFSIEKQAPTEKGFFSVKPEKQSA